MKPKYSKKLKKLMNSSGNLIGVAVCLALGLVLGIAAFEMSKTVNRGDTWRIPFRSLPLRTRRYIQRQTYTS